MKQFVNLFRIAYHGSEFHGSQIQPDVLTVEGILREKLIKIGASNPKFASRTDKGVNAIGNIVTTKSNLKSQRLVGKLIEELDNYPIWITGFSDVNANFNPRNAEERLYRYHLFETEIYSSFSEVMQLFVGEFDFEHFAKLYENDVTNTKRTIKKIETTLKDDIIICNIIGKSFLWHQIRKMIGAAIDVAQGRKTRKDIIDALDGKKIEFSMARPEFLTLINIEYQNIHIQNIKNERIMKYNYEFTKNNSIFWKELR